MHRAIRRRALGTGGEGAGSASAQWGEQRLANNRSVLGSIS
jgi:hypothetical protein